MVVWNAPTVAVGWVIMKTTLKHKIRGWGEWKALLILVTLSWSEATRDGATVPICEYEIIRPNPEYVFIHSLHSRWKATFIQHITYCLTRPFEGNSWVTVSSCCSSYRCWSRWLYLWVLPPPRSSVRIRVTGLHPL